MSLRDAALALSSLGWHVFPLGERSKIPATQHGCKDASADTKKVREWWSADGLLCNLGVATGGASDVLVLDVDGLRGEQSLRALEDTLGALPETVQARTGRGRHLYFRYPGSEVRIRNSAGKLGEGLDIRSDGGYVVAPPSIHPDGGAYEWVKGPHQLAPAQLPDWMLHRLVAPEPKPPAPYTPSASYGHTRYGQAALEAECRELAAAGEGTRNDQINLLGFRIGQLVRARHLNEGMARAEATAAWVACGVDRNERKANDTFDRGFKAGFESPNPNDPDPDDPPPGKLRLVRPRDPGAERDEAPMPSDADAPIYGVPPEPEQTGEREAPAAVEPAAPLSLTAEETAHLALMHLTDESRAKLPRTGFPRLDDALGGFPPGTLTTVGGRTGAGKSSLLLSIAMNQAGPKGQGHKVGIISCEDAEWIWGSRILSLLEDVNPEQFFKQPPDPYVVGRAVQGVQQARDYGVHFAFAIGKPLRRILQLADHLIRKQSCTLLMVDYLQAISAVGQDRYAARTDAAQAIKGLCHDRGVALLLASQLKRPEVGNPYKEPTHTDLKDSGDIENMSEAVLLLWPTSDEENAPVLGKVSKVKWSFRRPRFQLERHPKSGALKGLIEAPNTNAANRNSREGDWR